MLRWGCTRGLCSVPWNLLYADDLVITADSLDECRNQFKNWREGMEKKGLRVNMKKTKFMVSGSGLDVLKDSGKHPCAVLDAREKEVFRHRGPPKRGSHLYLP